MPLISVKKSNPSLPAAQILPERTALWKSRTPFAGKLTRQRARRLMNASARQDGIFSEATEILSSQSSALPRLIVLDLDYTIWPYWCEMYNKRDAHMGQLFPQTRQIIEACKNFGIPMAVASRSPTPDVAQAFLSSIGLAKGYFKAILIIPYQQKDEKHFPQLHKMLGIAYNQMLFFDDEHDNVRRVSRLGVTSVLVSTGDGVCLKAFRRGIEAFAKRSIS